MKPRTYHQLKDDAAAKAETQRHASHSLSINPISSYPDDNEEHTYIC